MDKILLVKKEQDYTSRDVVNIISKTFNTKKVGHFGTLDPLATGILVIGIGACTRIGNFLRQDDKEYVAEVKVGIATDSYDVLGEVLEEKKIEELDEKRLKNVLASFKKTYMQEVPIYSAVKVGGKKLYEYARNNESVALPSKEVTIKEIEFLDVFKKEDDFYFTFRTNVTKGTYIRSLINDISKELKIPLAMSNLERTRQDKFKLEDAYSLEDIKNGNYKLLNPEDILDCKIEEIKNKEANLIFNGGILENRNRNLVMFQKDGKNIALYDVYKKDETKIKPVIVFKGDE